MNQPKLETCPCEISYSKDELPRRKRHPLRAKIQQPDDPTIRHIPLTQGQIAIVDALLYDWLKNLNWAALWCKTTRSYYAVRSCRVDGKKCAVYMHREILGLRQGSPQMGDHENGITLDNRGANLRPSDHRGNSANSRIKRRSISGFRGVYQRPGRSDWHSSVEENGKHRNLGCFDNPLIAAKVRDVAALEIYGEFAVLNFPELIEEYRDKLAMR